MTLADKTTTLEDQLRRALGAAAADDRGHLFSGVLPRNGHVHGSRVAADSSAATHLLKVPLPVTSTPLILGGGEAAALDVSCSRTYSRATRTRHHTDTSVLLY